MILVDSNNPRYTSALAMIVHKEGMPCQKSKAYITNRITFYHRTHDYNRIIHGVYELYSIHTCNKLNGYKIADVYMFLIPKTLCSRIQCIEIECMHTKICQTCNSPGLTVQANC